MTEDEGAARTPLSGEIQFQKIDLKARWKLAVADRQMTDEEIAAFEPYFDRYLADTGVLAMTVDVIATAARGTRGLHSKCFVEKVAPLRRRRKQLEVVWASDERDAA
jgi:hypothetical protein